MAGPAKALAALLIMFCCAGGVLAQNGEENEASHLNYAFAVYLGSGIYNNAGRTVYIFRIPATIAVRKLNEDRAFGIKARLATTLGFYDFEPGDLIDTGLPERVATLTFVPGMEFQIPVFPKWTLKPPPRRSSRSRLERMPAATPATHRSTTTSNPYSANRVMFARKHPDV